jgi:hypothetical protein
VKSIINILLFCFVTLTVAPASLLLLNTLKEQCDPDSYREKCVMSDENESCAMSDMECCPGMCNPAQCCFCCFLCTVDNKKPEIKIFESNVNKQISDDQFDLSDFSSDCWQPPKSSTRTC